MGLGRFNVALITSAALVACSGGDAALGERCSSHGDCASDLQCLHDRCVPTCIRAPDCGDGYACDEDQHCVIAEGQNGDSCASEVDCAPGLSCKIDDVEEDGRVISSCAATDPGAPEGASCTTGADCRNGNCELGRCIDLCADTRDCARGSTCNTIPFGTTADWTTFAGCLPSRGTITYSVPYSSMRPVPLAVPSSAAQVSLVMSVDDPALRVGAEAVRSPGAGTPLFTHCTTCNGDFIAELEALAGQPVRHSPGHGQSVLAMPSRPEVALETGIYAVDIAAKTASGASTTTIPRITSVIRLDGAVRLNLHFYFLDLTEHPCREATLNQTLNGQTAAEASFFQSDYLEPLRQIFSPTGISFGEITYEDITNRPELDGLDVKDVGALLTLGTHADGVNIFFVRTMSPVGIQGFAPGPGPSLAGTRQSGIVVSADTLCYRSWSDVARLTAHEIARYMGLYRNRELRANLEDPIADSPSSPTDPATENNLMFFSELGGTSLSRGQIDILLRSPVLR